MIVLFFILLELNIKEIRVDYTEDSFSFLTFKINTMSCLILHVWVFYGYLRCNYILMCHQDTCLCIIYLLDPHI